MGVSRHRLPGMWEQDPVGVDLRRPMWAFAVVSVLCAFLVVGSVGRGDALRGVFDSPRPISATTTTRAPVAEVLVVQPAEPVADPVAVPAELTAQPVGQASKNESPTSLVEPPAVSSAAEPPATPARSSSTAPEQMADKQAAKVDRKADKQADKQAAKVDRKADKQAVKDSGADRVG